MTWPGQHAQQIGKAGALLHRRLGTLVGHLDNLGGAPTRTINVYNELLGSLEGRVLPQARKFEGIPERLQPSAPVPTKLGDWLDDAQGDAEPADNAEDCPPGIYRCILLLYVTRKRRFRDRNRPLSWARSEGFEPEPFDP